MWSKMFVQGANWNIYIDKSSPLNEGLEKNQPRFDFQNPKRGWFFFSSINEIFFTCNFKDNNTDFVQGWRDNRDLK